jgi:hypothetical protein
VSPTIEGYENATNDFPWLAEKKACPAKEVMTNCLYTTQGQFLCQKEVGQDTNVPSATQQKQGHEVAKTASPWLS